MLAGDSENGIEIHFWGEGGTGVVREYDTGKGPWFLWTGYVFGAQDTQRVGGSGRLLTASWALRLLKGSTSTKSHCGAHGIWHPRPRPGILLLGVHSNCSSEEGKMAARPQDNLHLSVYQADIP